jgi:hypothetical protein
MVETFDSGAIRNEKSKKHNGILYFL